MVQRSVFSNGLLDLLRTSSNRQSILDIDFSFFSLFALLVLLALLFRLLLSKVGVLTQSATPEVAQGRTDHVYRSIILFIRFSSKDVHVVSVRIIISTFSICFIVLGIANIAPSRFLLLIHVSHTPHQTRRRTCSAAWSMISPTTRSHSSSSKSPSKIPSREV